MDRLSAAQERLLVPLEGFERRHLQELLEAARALSGLQGAIARQLRREEAIGLGLGIGTGRQGPLRRQAAPPEREQDERSSDPARGTTARETHGHPPILYE
ncbi:hypothetical protein D3C86_1779580 [compost metagenome]